MSNAAGVCMPTLTSHYNVVLHHFVSTVNGPFIVVVMGREMHIQGFAAVSACSECW